MDFLEELSKLVTYLLYLNFYQINYLVQFNLDMRATKMVQVFHYIPVYTL